ncbi:23S rRNA (guanosine(2251)-2'-O)-methyltransferase RlmB [Trueperella pecoris]|uniref:23S rRNA (Guanosine(2251)-2'-O)-methyltransferase RlmB n=1 Tax=Trueperella pecoris TaxID=2733571 RepID=A0A7M1QUL1_9ACTO|nr:23S rRNA (guanosine(2251)-2'-O)-methyltransferase RlmB [Trueperella pecoris]QOR45503.1 23S rRNA (guanosine(2251)-2'-O)-methyltransferase RlmB [Trueperella pecoris]
MANAHRGRPGAVRKNARKGASKGTGGHSRKRLEGRGPTPKAEDRTYHPAYKKKQEREAAARKAEGPKLRGILRQPEGYELVAGRNPVYEAVQSGVPYERVFLVGAMSHDERVAEVARAAMATGTTIVEVTRTELDKMTDGAVHQGIAIEVPPFDYADVEDLVEIAAESIRPGLIVALDSVTDPHNLGAVMRSAAAFRADGVLIPERRSASVNATVWKVSAGAAARLPVARETNLVRALKHLKELGYFVVGLAGDGDAVVGEVNMADVPLVLVTGSEGGGLSRLVRETCDVVASIPIDGSTESLNAAVATGIALYQIDQHRRSI